MTYKEIKYQDVIAKIYDWLKDGFQSASVKEMGDVFDFMRYEGEALSYDYGRSKLLIDLDVFEKEMATFFEGKYGERE